MTLKPQLHVLQGNNDIKTSEGNKNLFNDLLAGVCIYSTQDATQMLID